MGFLDSGKSNLKQLSTPSFVYDAESINEQISVLKNHLPNDVEIFYSVKANPSIAIIQEMAQKGLGVELCSYYEIKAALLAGVKAGRMIFVGPAKSEREIQLCIELEIQAIICESLKEFEQISKIAAEKNKPVRVALRVNPAHVTKTAGLKMGGESVAFGIDESLIFENISFFLNQKFINLVGIHVYHGTRILDANSLIDNTQYIFNLADRIQTTMNKTLEFVDIGGGFGIPYFSNEIEINFTHLESGLTSLIHEFKNQYPNTRVILELGRFLVAKSGYLVTQVVDLKYSKGNSILITNGGLHCFMAAAALGAHWNRHFRISLISRQHGNQKEFEKYWICGPLCTPGDRLAKNIMLPKAEIGDWIIVHNAGAYAATASPVLFLSQGFPAEYLHKNQKLHLIREAHSEKDFFNNQKLIKEEENEE